MQRRLGRASGGVLEVPISRRRTRIPATSDDSYNHNVTFAAIEGPDLIIVLAVVLLLFGGAKLPQLARSLGEAKREFETATKENEPSSATGDQD